MNPRRPVTAMTFTHACLDGISHTVQTRLLHLFRHSLRGGRIHPLYQPILNYRSGHTPAKQR